MLTQYPSQAQRIDPERVFVPPKFGIVGKFQSDGDYERLRVLKEEAFYPDSVDVPTHRRLQRSTGRTDKYLLFHFDSESDVFLMLDDRPERMPQLHCQRAQTGEKLKSISDLEFDNEPRSFSGITARVSPDGKYVGAFYHLTENGISTYYTVVWVLRGSLGFAQTDASVPWARKIVSVTTNATDPYLAGNLLAFDNSNHVYCPNGRISLLTGAETPISLLNSLLDKRKCVFSSDGQRIAYYDNCAGVVLIHTCFKNCESAEQEIDPKVENDSTINLIGFSHSDRYLIWSTLYSLNVYDRQKSQNIQLRSGPWGYSYCLTGSFSPSDEFVIGTFSDRNVMKELNHVLYIWKNEASQFTLLRTEVNKNSFAGFCLDEKKRRLFVVSEKRVWTQTDLEANALRNRGDYMIVRHRISNDGRRLALMSLNINWYI